MRLAASDIRPAVRDSRVHRALVTNCERLLTASPAQANRTALDAEVLTLIRVRVPYRHGRTHAQMEVELRELAAGRGRGVAPHETLPRRRVHHLLPDLRHRLVNIGGSRRSGRQGSRETSDRR